jgi:hypothetical protein
MSGGQTLLIIIVMKVQSIKRRVASHRMKQNTKQIIQCIRMFTNFPGKHFQYFHKNQKVNQEQT